MKTDSEIKNRLYFLAEKLGMNPSQFSAKIGKDRTYLSNIRKEIQTDVLRNIYINLPEVNLIWVITGKGEMFLSQNEIANNENFLLKQKIADLEQEIKNLNRENGRLEGKIEMLTNSSEKSVG